MRPLIAVIALTAFTSCIKENLEDCEDPQGNLRVTFKLDEIVKPETSLLDYNVNNIHVYVFDSGNQFVKAVNGGTYTDEGYTIYMDLPGGNYHIVAWTNQGGIYKTNKTIEECEAEAVLKGELEYYLECNAGEALLDEIPDMLFGKMSQQVINGQENHVVVPMTPNTYRVNVTVKGLPETADRFDFTITDDNSHYTFDNAIVGGKQEHYHLRSCTQAHRELDVTFKTLRLGRDRNPLFVFKNAASDKELYNGCLVQTILNAYESSGQTVDFNVTHTFDIVLNYYEFVENNVAKLGVTVTVNGWEYIPSGSILK